MTLHPKIPHHRAEQPLRGSSPTAPHGSPALVGVPTGEFDQGPALVREASQTVPDPNLVLVDCGDLDIEHLDQDREGLVHAIRSATESLLTTSFIPCFVGGDASITAPIAGALVAVYDDLAVVRFDRDPRLDSNAGWSAAAAGHRCQDLLLPDSVQTVSSLDSELGSVRDRPVHVSVAVGAIGDVVSSFFPLLDEMPVVGVDLVEIPRDEASARLAVQLLHQLLRRLRGATRT